MANLAQQLIDLTKRLYPTGRAFRMRIGSTFEQINLALNETEQEAYQAAINILFKILPDNNNFTAQDATDWERRLGIVASPTTSLEDRKSAIRRKYAHPGNIPARQHYLYIQGQLQAAGFNVFVHENITGTPPETYVTGTPNTFGGESSFFGSGITFGSATLDVLVVNSIDRAADATFALGSDFRNTFFIGGEILGNFADVPAARETEFRQLILNLKPTHLAAVLLINYI